MTSQDLTRFFGPPPLPPLPPLPPSAPLPAPDDDDDDDEVGEEDGDGTATEKSANCCWVELPRRAAGEATDTISAPSWCSAPDRCYYYCGRVRRQRSNKVDS